MPEKPEECSHRNGLWLEGYEGEGWRVRCLQCLVLGPERGSPQ